MALFGRKKGRHALGAAVTSIPSGPLRAFEPLASVIPVPVADAPAPVVVPAELVPTAEPDLMASIAELIATGEAWSTGPAVPDGLPTLLSTPVPPPEPAVVQPIAPEAPPEGRVQLGFRDGTFTTLDPSSSQAHALEELAQSLTRRI